MHTQSFQVIRALSLILFTGFITGNSCFANNSEFGVEDKTPNQQEKKTLYYIGFAGRKMIKSLKKTEYVVEVYKLPGAIVMQLNKLQFSAKHYNYKAVKKQQLLLASHKDSCKVYSISNRLKYKYFYPCGLKNGMTIQENEFLKWDFVNQLDFNKPVVTPGKSDSALAITLEPLPVIDLLENSEKVNNSSENVKPETGNQTGQFIVPGMRTYVFYPWDPNAKIDSDTSYSPSFAPFIDSLFLHISGYSDYLGAQRIKLELFDQPFVADFYANMYIHYVDSIVNILKLNPLIKSGEYENFILYTSEIVTKRFKYGANSRLWQGIRKDRLDCDNTAYLVYDIGKKLGFEISVVFVPGHALVIAGDYAYETTRRDYFPKEQLKDHYSIIYLISSDPKLIHAMLSILEIAIVLEEKNEYKKANDFKIILQRYFPGMKYPS